MDSPRGVPTTSHARRLAAATLALAVSFAAACAPDGGASRGTSLLDTTAVSAPFRDRGVTGTLVVQRLSDGRTWIHAPSRADSAYLPASTFKIVNAAIALETRVVGGADDPFAWDGVERSVEAWNRDHTLKSAMAVSAVPVYQEIARGIGAERMASWLRRVDYGNADIGGGIDRFWLSGALRTSALDQVDFLTRFVGGATAFSPPTVDAVADLIRVDEGPGWSLHAKTGWADEAGVGWWTGWVRRGDETYVFALNMAMEDVAEAPTRIDIGREALVAVGALPRP